ncbi:uncharacterized protein K460DRAFT_287596, partial [Cucurbitaria berberidis CBS 394.84]
MPLEAPIDGHSESLPLLHNLADRRPYQPYCVTEASSRAQSPELLTPKPLRIIKSCARELDGDEQTQHSRDDVLDMLPARSAASSPGQQDSLIILPKTGSKSKRNPSLSNRISQLGNTKTASPNYIAQAVTPRGSHTLASLDEAVYDETLSHPWVQRPRSLYIATSQQVIRKPLPWRSGHAGMDYHPLPPLPYDTTATPEL